MEIGDVEETLKLVDSCISRIKWRLRPSSKRRLETDILALCTGLRPVVMVDYGGKMPELQDHLCALFHLTQKESTVLQPLRVMVIEDMIYIVHARGLAEHAMFSLSLQPQLLFVDLEQDPPKMLLQTELDRIAPEFVSIQKSFSSVLPVDELDVKPKTESSEDNADDLSRVGEHIASQSSEYVNLTTLVNATQVTLPTLNGWLLGYPVVYLFSKEHVADAIYNLSTKSLRIYKIVVCRNRTSGSGRKPCEEELMSFTVPYELSMGGEKEPWAEAFLAHMLSKLEKCKHIWVYLRLEVSECYPQAIVL